MQRGERCIAGGTFLSGYNTIMTTMPRRFPILLLLMSVFTTMLPVNAQKQEKEFKKWPAGKSPREIGKLVAEHFLVTPHTNFGRPGPPPQVTYPEVVSWYGALTFAQVTGNKDLQGKLVQRFQPLFGDEA
ncbi:MAG: hypothetical protein DMG97_15245, partial [Acidobacteria bacterium]